MNGWMFCLLASAVFKRWERLAASISESVSTAWQWWLHSSWDLTRDNTQTEVTVKIHSLISTLMCGYFQSMLNASCIGIVRSMTTHGLVHIHVQFGQDPDLVLRCWTYCMSTTSVFYYNNITVAACLPPVQMQQRHSSLGLCLIMDWLLMNMCCLKCFPQQERKIQRGETNLMSTQAISVGISRDVLYGSASRVLWDLPAWLARIFNFVW